MCISKFFQYTCIILIALLGWIDFGAFDTSYWVFLRGFNLHFLLTLCAEKKSMTHLGPVPHLNVTGWHSGIAIKLYRICMKFHWIPLSFFYGKFNFLFNSILWVCLGVPAENKKNEQIQKRSRKEFWKKIGKILLCIQYGAVVLYLLGVAAPATQQNENKKIKKYCTTNMPFFLFGSICASLMLLLIFFHFCFITPENSKQISKEFLCTQLHTHTLSLFNSNRTEKEFFYIYVYVWSHVPDVVHISMVFHYSERINIKIKMYSSLVEL